ncbi:hypothetical protein SAMN05216276_110316 [Streptosporangium subroseum]|uniref:Uncharacterized protein n=1 Tax=Streptosporangium subroseum TaxID=106412 RepID=A0A239P9D1_9ACTN|nr:hypothetical protein [Streptosporangium subroseum]SNT63647.1 hypothetical protein SAMN05216276_110316 [Streptosporangium subroseum]
MSDALLRVVWSPGSDHLTGVCHCGAEYRADGPIEVWQWLLAHPDHEAGIEAADHGASTEAPGHGASVETVGHGASIEASDREASVETLGHEASPEASID